MVISEELGVSKKTEDLEYLFEAIHDNILNNGTYIDREYYDTYKIVLTDDEARHLVPQPGEVDDFVWLTRDEFLSMHARSPEKFVEHPKDYSWIQSIQITQK